jgi:hypothetical protein
VKGATLQVLFGIGLLIGVPVPASMTAPDAVDHEYIDQLNTVPVWGDRRAIFALAAVAASGPEQSVELPTVPVTVGTGIIVTVTVAVPAGQVGVAGIV